MRFSHSENSDRAARRGILLPTLWLIGSIILALSGLFVLFQARLAATPHPTAVNTRLIKAKGGPHDIYVRPESYQLGLGMLGVGMVSTMVSGWVWGVSIDSRRSSERP